MCVNTYTLAKRMLEHHCEIMCEMVNIQEGDESILHCHQTQMAEARSILH